MLALIILRRGLGWEKIGPFLHKLARELYRLG